MWIEVPEVEWKRQCNGAWERVERWTFHKTDKPQPQWPGRVARRACAGERGLNHAAVTTMTLIEFLLSVVLVGNTALLSVVLVELRETRRTLAAQGSQRRRWVREEHRS